MNIDRLLHQVLAEALQTVLPHLQAPELVISFKRTSPDQEHRSGQWQSPSILKIAARLKLNTLTLAQEVCAVLQQNQYHYLKECFVTAPGFLNFNLHDDFLALQVLPTVRPLQEGKILIDFGGINIAKPLHIGHIRSLLIGETLRRVYCHCGFQIISDIHLGDWGAQLGIVITAIHTQYPDLLFFQANLTHYPGECPLEMDELLHLYQSYKQTCATDPILSEQVQHYIKVIQEQSHAGITALWQAILQLSKHYIKGVTDYLGAHFDLWHGESDVRDLIPALLRDGLKAGVIIRDQGALIIPLGPHGNMLVQKTDGCALYSTTDLATIQYRIQSLGVTTIIYVVDKRQWLHFQQLFQSASLLQLTGATKLIYVGFGTINDSEHKPFKTRTGQVMLLTTIMEQTLQAFQKQAQRDELLVEHAEAIALSTIKFALLTTAYDAPYRFDFAKFTQAEGKTGMYILYTAVRIKALQRQLQQVYGLQYPPFQPPFGEEIRSLILQLNQLDHTLDETMRQQDPVHLTGYLYILCQLFHHFYATTPIIKEENTRKRANYARVCQAVLIHLELVSNLLGLTLPDSL